MTQVIASYETCGCCRGVFVLDRRPEAAYRFAADEARDGAPRIETIDIEEWRARGSFCDRHRETQGPPEWPSNRYRKTAPGQVSAHL